MARIHKSDNQHSKGEGGLILFRLMIADDEETIRNGLKNLIESYELGLAAIYTAEDGREAIEIIEKLHPEIILMDINMPFVNGLDAIEKVREIVPESKIIIISGYDQFEYAQRALELGVFSYQLKPIQYRGLKDIVKKAIDAYCERMLEISKIKDNTEYLDQCSDIGNHVLKYLKENFMDNELSLIYVSEQFHISSSYLTRIIKQKTGLSFTNYINSLRINMAKSLLKSKGDKYTISKISVMVGYNSQHYFSRAFKNYTGCSPNSFRNALT